jgi:hypothetical protein
MFYI